MPPYTNMLVPVFVAVAVLLTPTSVRADGEPSPSPIPKETLDKIMITAMDEASKQIKDKGILDEKDKNEIYVPEDFSTLEDPDMMKLFSGLVKERRKIQRRMFYHIMTSVMVGLLTYFMRANPVLLHLFLFVNDHNESWGQNIEARWINHQEKMANFLLRVMEKKNIDARTVQGKKIRLEVAHNKFAVVPVYRSTADEPLPDDAKQINNNKVNLWKNFFNRK